MSSSTPDDEAWVRATRNQPCPICSKPDWCAFTSTIALCMRVESPRPSRGDAGGWLHTLAEQQPRTRRAIRLVGHGSVDFTGLSTRFIRAMSPQRLGDLASLLGVTEDALMATGVGWCRERNSWSWPMHDHQLRVVGIRLRDARSHEKFAWPGSKQGVFLAECADHFAAAELLVVTEGPTDLCAASDLGFIGIGRPSCNGGTRHIAALTRGREVVVVADADEPGRRGAQSLAATLLPTVRSVRVIEPLAPYKDLRAWLLGGADQDAVQAVIDAAPLQTIRVRIVR